MKQEIYVSTGNPLIFNKFEKFKAPRGWIRLDILKRRLELDEMFKNEFTKEELELIIGQK